MAPVVLSLLSFRSNHIAIMWWLFYENWVYIWTFEPLTDYHNISISRLSSSIVIFETSTSLHIFLCWGQPAFWQSFEQKHADWQPLHIIMVGSLHTKHRFFTNNDTPQNCRWHWYASSHNTLYSGRAFCRQTKKKWCRFMTLGAISTTETFFA